jgi:hypothetical protein
LVPQAVRAPQAAEHKLAALERLMLSNWNLELPSLEVLQELLRHTPNLKMLQPRLAVVPYWQEPVDVSSSL